MDFFQEKSSVNRLNLGTQLDLEVPEEADKIEMWTIPSLTEEKLRQLMEICPDLMKEITEKHIIPFLSTENDKFKLENASIFVRGPNKQKWKIISGHGKSEICVDCTDLHDPLITINADDNKPEEIHSKEISKIFLGKCIINKCGNEGTKKNELLRTLLQVAIDRLCNNYDKTILKNAKVFIYNSMETLILVSGDGRNSFVICSERGTPILRCITIEGTIVGKVVKGLGMVWRWIQYLWQKNF